MLLNWGARFRWLCFQWCLYSADMAEAAIDNFNAFGAERLKKQ
jgi:hypothetical protein